ncbi:unnamed protein product [Prorocentrum cordatum]|uniref:Uncharacterized protein n=1 Tax=Prorocentrum cordatum TaxID=2364126 RepID=A0ABN9SGE0_9DINO|nr:unnamed protein product [Polarella glacialis]
MGDTSELRFCEAEIDSTGGLTETYEWLMRKNWKLLDRERRVDWCHAEVRELAMEEARNWKLDWVIGGFCLDNHRVAVHELIINMAKKDSVAIAFSTQAFCDSVERYFREKTRGTSPSSTARSSGTAAAADRSPCIVPAGATPADDAAPARPPARRHRRARAGRACSCPPTWCTLGSAAPPTRPCAPSRSRGPPGMRAGLLGVTVPSQLRNIRYYEKMRQSRWAAAPMQTLQLNCVRVGLDSPSFVNGLNGLGATGCHPYFKVKVWQPAPGAGVTGPRDLVTVYNHRTSIEARRRDSAGRGRHALYRPPLRGHEGAAAARARTGRPVHGAPRLGGRGDVPHLVPHRVRRDWRCEVQQGDEVDMAHKDKKCQRFPPGFEVHLFLGPPNTQL